MLSSRSRYICLRRVVFSANVRSLRPTYSTYVHAVLVLSESTGYAVRSIIFTFFDVRKPPTIWQQISEHACVCVCVRGVESGRANYYLLFYYTKCVRLLLNSAMNCCRRWWWWWRVLCRRCFARICLFRMNWICIWRNPRVNHVFYVFGTFEPIAFGECELSEWSGAAQRIKSNEMSEKGEKIKLNRVLCVRDVVLLPSKWGDIILSRN